MKTSHAWRRAVCVLTTLLSLSVPMHAQTAPPATVNQALVAMAARAGVIFAGQVVAIDHADAAGYVDIRFRIDDAVKGCPRTGWYVLREWAGLWAGGFERYRAGQRLLMLLYARGPSGMSSPVNGLDGAIPIVPGGVAPLARGSGTAPADVGTGPVENLVDLRWLAAETLRPAAATAQATAKGWSGPVLPMRKLPAPVGSSALPSQISYSLVMGWLGASGPGRTSPVIQRKEVNDGR